ncbi:MAG TPA: hypothetical protein VFZ49_01070 [Pyrinomonadaceae bacterium]
MIGHDGDERADILPIATYLLVVAAVCLPIWFFDNFYNGDGPTHLQSAWVMTELAKGESPAGSFYTVNSAVVPNSLGHWLLAAMLFVVPAGVASKLMASGLFCCWVGAVAWLRKTVSGNRGLVISILFAGLLGLNRIWLVGLFNFLIGAIVVILALGLLVRWEGKLDLRRTLVLATCLAAAFLSHLVTFGILGLSAGIYVLMRGNERIRSLVLIGLASLPMIPFVIAYQLVNTREGAVQPAWYLLQSPLSVSSVILHIRGTDPFFIIGRRYVPFTSVESALNALSAPLLWTAVAIVIMMLAAWRSTGVKEWIRPRLPMFAVALVLLVLAAIMPDVLGSSEGSVIRPRFLLVAMAMVVSFIPIPTYGIAVMAAAVILIAAFGFQTLGLWEYAIVHNKEFAEFMPIREQVKDGERVASAMVFEEQLRFHPSPLQRISSLLAIGRDVVVWDSYEFGHYYFPVVAASAEDRRTIRDFSVTNIIRPNYSDESFDVGIANFAQQLEANRDKIDVMIVRGRNPRVDAELLRWFGPEPFYESANYRLFHKK